MASVDGAVYGKRARAHVRCYIPPSSYNLRLHKHNNAWVRTTPLALQFSCYEILQVLGGHAVHNNNNNNAFPLNMPQNENIYTRTQRSNALNFANEMGQQIGRGRERSVIQVRSKIGRSITDHLHTIHYSIIQ